MLPFIIDQKITGLSILTNYIVIHRYITAQHIPLIILLPWNYIDSWIKMSEKSVQCLFIISEPLGTCNQPKIVCKMQTLLHCELTGQVSRSIQSLVLFSNACFLGGREKCVRELGQSRARGDPGHLM